MGERKNAYRVLVGIPEKKRETLEDLGINWRKIFK
jgi:ribosomal protein L30/L7E